MWGKGRKNSTLQNAVCIANAQPLQSQLLWNAKIKNCIYVQVTCNFTGRDRAQLASTPSLTWLNITDMKLLTLHHLRNGDPHIIIANTRGCVPLYDEKLQYGCQRRLFIQFGAVYFQSAWSETEVLLTMTVSSVVAISIYLTSSFIFTVGQQ